MTSSCRETPPGKFFLVVVLGLPGCGKTTLCGELLRVFRLTFVETDRCWVEIFPVPEYSARESEVVFDNVCKRAKYSLEQRRHTLVEGVFASGERLVRLKQIATACSAEVYFFGLTCDRETAFRRMKERKIETGKGAVSEDLWIHLEGKVRLPKPGIAVEWLDSVAKPPQGLAAAVLRRLELKR